GLWTVSGANINRPSGNVGIGVASPAQKLEVLGNVKATAFISTSDRRLKRNIATVDGIEKVLKLRGVEFDWRANGEHEIGLIAQEVEAVYPDLVVTDPNTGYKAVKYSSLVSPLIEATKDLYGMCKAHDAQIKRLQAENAALKAKNQELESRLEAIERHLGLSK
ncbi:MAG TPA: tail fiber domain-containing protein, partial [Pseudobdellovibrionaceae bacterium]|nr:tail fiber domain-containing protein [Pseudobdellovibrionaceae bacterium]